MSVRIYLPEPLAANAPLTLPKAQSRHLQVLRMQPGDTLTLFNGTDGLEWPAEIVRIERQSVEVLIGAAFASDAALRELQLPVTLALGVPANERMDALVEKATELGVARIQPLLCERSVVRLQGDRAEARRLHWSAVAASASEQCGRACVPEIALPMKLDAWLRRLEPAGVGRIVLSLARSARAPDAFAADLRVAAPSSCVVLSGPEGGLSPSEEASAVAVGFVPVSLGPRVLRADTAPLVLLAWLDLALQSR